MAKQISIEGDIRYNNNLKYTEKKYFFLTVLINFA